MKISSGIVALAFLGGSVHGLITRVEPDDDDFIEITAKLKIADTYVPDVCDKVAQPGLGLWVNYAAYIDESSVSERKGEMFDTTDGRGPFHFKLGDGEVIQGWDMGIAGMCKGARRRLIIPPELAYGMDGLEPKVPSDATLRFDIELKQVMDPYDFDNIFDRIDTDNSKTLDHDEVEKFFDSRGSKTPADLWKVEDKNGDGVIEWEEFTGPKGPSGDDDAFLRDENEHVVGDKPQEDL
jgi:hypothetical protein